MTELLHTVASVPTLLLVTLMFGFAPGFCLRLFVLAYPREDPRRTELVAELYKVPRIQRPLWVAEQLETVLFEGLPHRLAAVLRWAGRPHRARAKAKRVAASLVYGLAAVVFIGFTAVTFGAFGLAFADLARLGLGALGLGTGLLTGWLTGLLAVLVVGLPYGLMVGRVAGRVAGRMAGRMAGRVVGLLAGLQVGVWAGLAVGLGDVPASGAWFGLGFGVVLGIANVVIDRRTRAPSGR
jgi:hypothetical protein